MIYYFTAAIGGYLLGSLNGAQLIHHALRRYYPTHITRVGTKNAGAQNVWMFIGKFPAIFVFLIDFSKGYGAVLIPTIMGLAAPFTLIGGIAAVVGHNWPVFFHFRGGRGVAALAGALFAFDFHVAIIIGLISIPFILIRWSGLTPFVMIAGVTYAKFSLYSYTLVLLMGVLTFIIIGRRLHAEWSVFKRSERKLWVLKNIIWYDRAGANPPSLKEVFHFGSIDFND